VVNDSNTPGAGVVSAAPARTLSVIRPSEPAAVPYFRRAAVDFATSHGAVPEVVDDVALAVSEAATNAVKHSRRAGAGHKVGLEAAVEGGGWLEVRVSDQGEGFGNKDSDGLGVGLTIMARLASQLTITQEGEGTQVRMRFLLARRA
jgi:anti-sigma regulatory factor (Ser/Thr protein kinase)